MTTDARKALLVIIGSAWLVLLALAFNTCINAHREYRDAEFLSHGEGLIRDVVDPVAEQENPGEFRSLARTPRRPQSRCDVRGVG
ncbi:hypothetical protein LCGC14_1736740, partial [marine sediment metagenome]